LPSLNKIASIGGTNSETQVQIFVEILPKFEADEMDLYIGIISAELEKVD